MLIKCSFTEATHVIRLSPFGAPELKIIGRWGLDKEGRVAKPSEGGFGCIVEDGSQVDMWNALCYLKEVGV